MKVEKRAGSSRHEHTLPKGAKTRLAVLDLGSTSFHLLVADASPSGELVRVGRRRERLRLGTVLAEHGAVPEPMARRAVATARRLQQEARVLGAARLLPVATAALREAANGAVLAERIGSALEVPVRVLSGEEEARLIFGAFRHRVSFGEAEVLGLDLGGGSLELALGNALDLRWEATLPLGVARLHRELARSDPMRRRERKALRSRVEALLEPLRADLEPVPTRLAIASGGTARALARLLASGPPSTRAALPMPREALGRLAERLVASSAAERRRLPIPRGRAELLPTGAVVLHALADALEIPELVVCDWGLREGVLLEALGRVSAVPPGA